MIFPGFKKANNRAIAGFFIPLLAAGLAATFVLLKRDHILSSRFWLLFIIIIPVILLIGLYLSIKSIPLIDELGDKDYAYSGLVLNIFFILLYIFSAIYCFWISA